MRQSNLVVVLVALLETRQDVDRLINRGRSDHHRLEPTLQRAILLYVLPILVQRGRADALELASGQRGLQHIRRVDRTFSGPRAHQRVDFVDEEDDVAILCYLIHYRFEPLLELTAILRPRDHGRHIESEHAVAFQTVRHLSRRNQLRQTLHDCRLTDPGLADEHRVVLLAAR